MLKCLLAPAALLYKAGVTFRHRLFDWGILKSEKFDIPVICIGNITVGGTGKTPMAEMVIAYMSQMHRVALLSRGYGRRTKGYLEVKADSRYRDVGDEPLQIKLKFPDTVVAVCEKRADGIRRICAEHPDVDLIVMDDGFQHRYVEPKVNIVMIDATRPVQHDRMLPLGTLRDLPEELHRAHYFVVTKCPEKMAPIDRRILRKVLIQVAYQRVYFIETSYVSIFSDISTISFLSNSDKRTVYRQCADSVCRRKTLHRLTRHLSDALSRNKTETAVFLRKMFCDPHHIPTHDDRQLIVRTFFINGKLNIGKINNVKLDRT